MAKNIYGRLAKHLSALELAPPKKGLDEILRENFTPLEAEIALALPNNTIPLLPASAKGLCPS